MNRARVLRRALAALVLAALAAGWLTFAPTRLGGPATLLTTHGISMEPRFHTGDLAIIRPSSTYRVGDIAAYHSSALDTVVMHRIVAIKNGHYSFKGDNNNWIDPQPATRDELIGTLAARVPQGGVWLKRLSSPTAIALLALLLIVGGGTATARRRRRRHRMARHAAPATRAPVASSRPAPVLSTLSALPAAARTVAATAAVVGLLGVVLAAFAWTRPVSATVQKSEPSARSMRFGYTATVPDTAVYSQSTVHAPDPIFRKLIHTITVDFTYRGGPATLTPAVELSTGSGWHTSLPLGAPEKTTGSTYRGSGTLDLDALDARAQAAATVTGIPATQATVAVVVHARLADGTDFDPALHLTLSPLEVTLSGQPSALTVTDTATTVRDVAAPRQLGIFGRHLAVATARIVSVAALLLALVAGAVLALFARLLAPADEAERIRRRHPDLLLPVNPMPVPAGHPVVDVAEFPTLARLAQRYGLLVLHWSRAGTHTFLVQDDGVTYRYRSSTEAADTPAVAADVPAEATTETTTAATTAATTIPDAVPSVGRSLTRSAQHRRP